MPNYGFICDGCNHQFDRLLPIKDRDIPLSEGCPRCGDKKISKDFSGMRQSMAADSTLTPDKATGGQWSELMSRMKSGLGKRHHENLDKATNAKGRSWLG